MPQFIPLVRAGAVLPLVRLALDLGRPAHRLLQSVDLACVQDWRAERPVPLLSALRFFRLMAEREGPDVAARAVTPHSISDLGPLGIAVFSASTPGEALEKVARVLPKHSTHEHITLRATGSGARLTLGWSLKLDDVELHLTQQFAAALVLAICRAAVPAPVPASQISLRPHPTLGLAHLEPHFGSALVAACEPVLDIDIPHAILNQRFPDGVSNGAEIGPEWENLRDDGSFASSARHVLRALLDDPPPTIDRLCAAAGISRRSVQRSLAQEGTNFRQLLDEARRDQVIRAVFGPKGALANVSASVGYSSAAATNHAVRRWTGASPRDLVRERTDQPI